MDQAGRMAVGLKAKSGYHRQKYRFAGPGFGLVQPDLVAQLAGIFRIDDKRMDGKFHLTQVDHPVAPIDNQVDLRPLIVG